MSVDPVTSLAGGGLSGTGLGTVTGVLQGGVNNLVNFSSNFLDRFFPPEKREQWKAWLMKFATERPYLASFLLSQIALSCMPLALFALMTLTVFIFALLAGILVGVLGALLFIVAAVGFALIILLPILFFTTGAAVFIWLWGMAAYFIVKWFNQKDVPGVHTDLADGLSKASGLNDLPGVNGNPLNGEGPDLKSAVTGSSEEQQHNETPSKPGKTEKSDKGEKGSSTGAQYHADGKENQSHPRKLAPRPSSTGPTGKASSAVDGVSKGVSGSVGTATKTLGL
ncbi:uncharacterized protein A1O9_02008 [Exophiala aquamarina CBS 119918]|uniref:Uncharacterized protein n=1 Tax=Exophiala aquamarina CBS 119918 TaxID=1182545 RepID=A0A072PL19_9EURO|nr:uncharacterized protein A1O9_02008 [Exophiala aquamarina CBS 119918]KEF60447.1 hypothetical protein A1O9_02008 [Exophiala aquamarina CBS 119918]